MGKITVTISDTDTGGVNVKFDPPMSELIAYVKRIGEENAPGSYNYAAACAGAVLKVSNEAKRMEDKFGIEEIKNKSKIWMPAISKVAKIWQK